MEPTNIFKNIIERITLSWKNVRNNSHNIKLIKKVSNKGDIVGIQADTVKVGYSSSEVSRIITNTLGTILPVLESQAKAIYKERTTELENKVNTLLLQLPQEDVVSKLSDPEMQLALKEATLITGKKEDKELRELLSNIVFKKIKEQIPNKDTLKNIVYTEAIRTMDKVTPNQIKIITLCYLIKHTQNTGVVDWNSMETYFKKCIKPFLDFHSTIAEFQHIEYAGCGTVSGFGTGGIISILKQTYAFLFNKPIPKENVLKSFDDLSNYQEIFINATDTEIRVAGRNAEELRNYLEKKKFDTATTDKIIGFFNQQQNGVNAEEIVKDKSPYFQELIDIWKATKIDGLRLTSVGIVIGAVNYEQITGHKIDIDIWIN